MKLHLLPSAALFVASTSLTFASFDYSDPTGGWDYIFEGNTADISDPANALDGNWTENIGSSAIDTASPGATAGTDSGVDFLRMVDSETSGGDNNRKVGFAYNLEANDSTTGSFLDNGFTSSFRLRTTAGYPIRDFGKGMINFHQNVGTVAKFGFTLTSAGDFLYGDGTFAGSDTLISGLTASDWNEFWITIEANPIADYDVNIYVNGSTTASYSGTIAARAFSDEIGGKNHLSMQVGSTAVTGDVDVDFFGWTADGAFAPVPEPSAYALIAGMFALGWIMIRRRRLS